MSYELEVFYDGECKMCRRDFEHMRSRDKHQRVKFINIAAPEFEVPAGRTWEELMARIWGRLPNGQWIEGADVFRIVYGAAGYRLLAAFVSAPVFRQIFTLGYRLIAKNRLRLTGRGCDGDTCTPKVRLSSIN